MPSWLHFGDLHIDAADAANHRDLLALVDVANRHLAGRVDFAVLPGDNADQGSAAQFRLVRAAIDRLEIPVHILPGDHDFHPRNLDDFHAVLGAAQLPEAVHADGHDCLFLDVVSPGTGGPDFRLDAAQLEWLADRLAAATAPVVLFMHCYPDDLKQGKAALMSLLARHDVACVDMGHTHYNELANDGRTVFMATRSTGQIEEGPVGFSIGAVEGDAVSWRFQPLDASWPLVLITTPADRRLARDAAAAGTFRIGVRIWGAAPIIAVDARIDGGAPVPLRPDPDRPGRWIAPAGVTPADGLHDLIVTATDAAGNTGEDRITFRVGADPSPPRRHRNGSDRDAIAAWPERHLLATQLGPNRNGRKW